MNELQQWQRRVACVTSNGFVVFKQLKLFHSLFLVFVFVQIDFEKLKKMDCTQ